MEKNETKKQLKRIYRRRHRGGRGVPAYLCDAAAVSALVLLAIYLCVRPQFKNRVAAELVTVVCGGAVFCVWRIVDRELLARCAAGLRREARKSVERTKLLMNSTELFERIPERGDVIPVRSIEAVTADDILNALAAPGSSPLTVVSFARPTEAAEAIISASEREIKLVSPAEYLGADALKKYRASEEEIDAEIIKRYAKKRKKLRIRELFTLTRERAFKYLALGAGLFIMSFFLKYALYYRVMASLSLSVGAYVFAAEEIRRRRKAAENS